MMREYISPITANCASISGVESTLAPTSITTTGLPFNGRKSGGEGGTVDAADHTQDHLRGGHAGAGVAGRNHALRGAFALQPAGHADGGVLLGSESFGSRIVHGDDFAGMMNADGQIGGGGVFAELALQNILLADQHHSYVGGGCGPDRAFDFRLGGVIAAHGVNGDSEH